MNIYKVYIKDNKEFFQIWDSEEKQLLKEYSDFFTRALCDYVSLNESDITLIAELIGTEYNYMESTVNGKLYKEYPPNKGICTFSPLFMFMQDQKESFYKDHSDTDYLTSTWFDYPIAKNNDFSQPELSDYLLREYKYIKTYFENTLIGNTMPDIDWKRTISLSLESINGEMCQVLYPKHTSDIVFFLFIEMFKQNIQFKVCKRCEKIFPCFNHKGVQFCERLDVSRNETCRQIKLSRVYYPDDPEYLSAKETILDIYQKAYKRNRRRVDYGQVKNTDFKVWSKKIRKQRDLCLKQVITIAEFEEWIKENDWNYEEE